MNGGPYAPAKRARNGATFVALYDPVDSTEPGNQVGKPWMAIMSSASALSTPNGDDPSAPETSLAWMTNAPGRHSRSTPARPSCQAATSPRDRDDAAPGSTCAISSPRSTASTLPSPA